MIRSWYFQNITIFLTLVITFQKLKFEILENSADRKKEMYTGKIWKI